ncbi:hypothetical protein PS2_034284 [Malus domestica]
MPDHLNIVLPDTTKIHQLVWKDTAYTLQDTKNTYSGNKDLANTDIALKHKERHHPDNGKHHLDPTDHKYQTLELAGSALVVA